MDSQLTAEEFNLHNPAYCGFLIYSMLREHQSFEKNGLNSALIYLFLPFVLTKSISSKLPKSFKTSFVLWIVENEGELFNISSRVSHHFEVTQSAIDFLVQRNLITLDEQGYMQLVKSKLPVSPALFNKSSSMQKHLSVSKLLGKWFANSPDATTIYSVLGIKP